MIDIPNETVVAAANATASYWEACYRDQYQTAQELALTIKKQEVEIDRLCAEIAEMRAMLINLRHELTGYELDATGESYNNTELNALLAKPAKEGT